MQRIQEAMSTRGNSYLLAINSVLYTVCKNDVKKSVQKLSIRDNNKYHLLSSNISCLPT